MKPTDNGIDKTEVNRKPNKSLQTLKSLDPRVARLPQIDVESPLQPKAPLDQFGTFEVFVQAKEGKPFQHEGIVHASDLEMAFILAKESLTRRFTCISLFVTDTRHVTMSATTEGDANAYDTIKETASNSSKMQQFEVFHLPKRGKQHVHAGTVEATSIEEAFPEAKKKFGSVKVYNVWVVPTEKIRFTTQEEKDLWKTLPDKRFRDAADYKGGDKLKEFLERK
jgi:ring-1,2-phenylacetyl-CoA epoxidase subunit PaaB